jgi:hypothetical protein
MQSSRVAGLILLSATPHTASKEAVAGSFVGPVTHAGRTLPQPDFFQLNGTSGAESPLSFDNNADTWQEAAYNPKTKVAFLLLLPWLVSRW